jgi:hypothetical protein
MERRMTSSAGPYVLIRRCLAAFLVVAWLTSTARAQGGDTPSSPAPTERRPEEASTEANQTETDENEDENQDFIETDRNSFTFARVTPGEGRLIVESSFSYINLTDVKTKYSFPELLLRYGIGDRFELRLGWNFETGRERGPGGGSIAGFFAANAEQQVYYGFKTVVSKQSGWFPGSAFLLQGHTPTGGPQSVSQLRTGYVLGWTLPNRWDFDAGFRFGTDKDEEGSYRLWAPSAVLKIPLTRDERWFSHVEYFSVMTQGKENDTNMQFVDLGLHHLFTPNIEAGVIVAFGPHPGGMNLVTNVGIGVRF